MEKHISIAEAKNNLPSLVHEVENGPPAILTRYGKKVAVLLSIADYEKSSLGKQGFWSALMDWRKAMDDEKNAFSDDDFSGLRDRTVGRTVAFDTLEP